MKKPGTLRVGLLPISNKSDAKLETDMFNEATLESFSETDLDIVRLSGTSPGELEADARSKEVDLVLTSTIAEVKNARGGIVGKINGSSGDAFSAKVDYALVPPGQPKPRQSGSERSGGSTLNSAISIAKKVAPFAPPLMMMKYGYMNAYGSMLSGQGNPAGAMQQSPDPVMNMAFSLLDRATANKPQEQSTTAGGRGRVGAGEGDQVGRVGRREDHGGDGEEGKVRRRAILAFSSPVAGVVKLADARDSKSRGDPQGRVGSTPTSGTKKSMRYSDRARQARRRRSPSC